MIGTVKINEQIYKTVQIGDQTWLAENLKIIHYLNGDAIQNVTDDQEWTKMKSGAYCAYKNDKGNAEIYGYLYNWHTIMDKRSIAPKGWHVPTDADWKKLVDHLVKGRSGETENAWPGRLEGGKLKEAGTSHWEYPNEGADNETLFTALPGGYRHDYFHIWNSSFVSLGEMACFWTSTEDENYHDEAFVRSLNHNNLEINKDPAKKWEGCSIRLVRD